MLQRIHVKTYPGYVFVIIKLKICILFVFIYVCLCKLLIPNIQSYNIAKKLTNLSSNKINQRWIC